MKLIIPAKTVLACDICNREMSYPSNCLVCKRQYCVSCEAIVWGCIHQPELCKDCGKLDSAQKVVKRFAIPLCLLLKQRDKALRRIKIKS